MSEEYVKALNEIAVWLEANAGQVLRPEHAAQVAHSLRMIAAYESGEADAALLVDLEDWYAKVGSK